MTAPKIKPGEPIEAITKANGAVVYRALATTSPKGAAKRTQSRKTFETLAAARRWINEVRAARETGARVQAPSRLTVADVAKKWLDSRDDIRPKSVKGYRDALRSPLSRIGRRPVQQVTATEVSELVRWLATAGGVRGKGLSRRSVEYALTSLRLVFGHAVVLGLITANPCDPVRLPRATREQRKAAEIRRAIPWTRGEYRAFCEYVDLFEQDATMRAAYRLSLCGLRRGEVLGLSWGAVDFESGTVHIDASRVTLGAGEEALDDPKSEASNRTLPVDVLLPGTMTTLRAARAAQTALLGHEPAPDALVVVGATQRRREPTTPIGPDAYSKRWKAMCIRAGVRPISVHKARHTLATSMAAESVPITDIAALLGHTPDVCQRVYALSTPEGRIDAAAAAARAIFGVAGVARNTDPEPVPETAA